MMNFKLKYSEHNRVCMCRHTDTNCILSMWIILEIIFLNLLNKMFNNSLISYIKNSSGLIWFCFVL